MKKTESYFSRRIIFEALTKKVKVKEIDESLFEIKIHLPDKIHSALFLFLPRPEVKKRQINCNDSFR